MLKKQSISYRIFLGILFGMIWGVASNEFISLFDFSMQFYLFTMIGGLIGVAGILNIIPMVIRGGSITGFVMICLVGVHHQYRPDIWEMQDIFSAFVVSILWGAVTDLMCTYWASDGWQALIKDMNTPEMHKKRP